jgi:lysophospholipase L1-like esterase
MSAQRTYLSELRARVSQGRTPSRDARSRRRRPFGIVAAAVLVVAALGAGSAATGDGPDRDTHWVGTWTASPQPAGAPVQIDGQTVRQIVHTSLGGDHLRVRVSNAYGSTPLRIGSAHAALSAGGLSIVEGTDRILRFNGSATISVPAGALVVSDPVTLDLPALGDLAVSLFLPDQVTATTEHTVAIQTTYLSVAGDFTGASAFEATTTQSYYLLSGVEVSTSKRARAVVAIGDSVTVGFGSTPDLNRRWPNLLAERLQSNPSTSHLGVLNAGVIGNRILHDFVGTGGLARFDRDVLVQPGVGFVIVLQGNADILIPRLTGNPSEVVTVAQIIQGHQQMIDRAHALGLKIFGCTLNPLEGYPFPGFWTTDLEDKRQSVNLWIRTSGAYDGVIDVDRLLSDPGHPSRLLPAYDSGDHVHPNDQGYQVMADAIDLSMFREDNQK